MANQKSNAVVGPSPVKMANASENGAGTQTAESAPEIRKAIPVQPQEKRPVEIRRAIPVKPLDQEDGNQTLLKSATPVPGDSDE